MSAVRSIELKDRWVNIIAAHAPRAGVLRILCDGKPVASIPIQYANVAHQFALAEHCFYVDGLVELGDDGLVEARVMQDKPLDLNDLGGSFVTCLYRFSERAST